MNEDIVIPIAGMIMVIVITLGIPLVIMLGKKWNRESAAPRAQASPDIARQLDHMTQALDAMAVEIERISEGQRFVTKLLAERPREPVAIPRSTEG
jgi:hypothetical protein